MQAPQNLLNGTGSLWPGACRTAWTQTTAATATASEQTSVPQTSEAAPENGQ